jgi:hypothetical protein
LATNFLDGLVKNQLPIEIVSIGNDEPIGRVISFLRDRQCIAVNIVSDHAEEIFRIIDKLEDAIQIGVYNHRQKWSRISNGTFEKWMPAGSVLFLWPQPGVDFHMAGVVKFKDHGEVQSTGMVKFLSANPFWIGEASFPAG